MKLKSFGVISLCLVLMLASFSNGITVQAADTKEPEITWKGVVPPPGGLEEIKVIDVPDGFFTGQRAYDTKHVFSNNNNAYESDYAYHWLLNTGNTYMMEGFNTLEDLSYAYELINNYIGSFQYGNDDGILAPDSTTEYTSDKYLYLMDENLKLTRWQVSMLISLVNYDHPDYYVGKGYYSWSTQDANTGEKYVAAIALWIVPEYYKGNVRRALNDTLKRNIDLFLSSLEISSTSDDYELEKAIYDKLCEDYTYSYVDGEPDPRKTAHSIVGLFDDDEETMPVCEGWAKSLQLLLNYSDVPCIYVSGGNHAWNLVKLDGQYYFADVTWDDGGYEDVLEFVEYFYPEYSGQTASDLLKFLETAFPGEYLDDGTPLNEELMSYIYQYFNRCSAAFSDHTIADNKFPSTTTINAKLYDLPTVATSDYEHEIAVTGVRLDKNELLLAKGESAELTAEVIPENAENQTVTWSSNNNAVATVDNGVVTTVKDGTATIVVTTEDGGYTATCKVTVTSGGSTTVFDGVDYAAVYDYTYYSSYNPDIKAAFGANQNAALQHFVEYGMNEGRQASEEFNVGIYRMNYPDLVSVFGENLKEYYLHYINYGKNEGRIANIEVQPGGYDESYYSPVYDYDYYCTNNSDVVAVFGTDRVAILRHFVENGMQEGRQGNEEFNIQAYKDHNSDLVEAFGDNLKAYYLHYIDYGKNEGRIAHETGQDDYDEAYYAPVYDYDYYRMNNPDVEAVFGTNRAAILRHFVENGMQEGRQANEAFNVYAYMNNNADLLDAFGNDLKAYYLHYIEFGRLEGRISTY